MSELSSARRDIEQLREALAGFESFEAMKGWFRETYGLPFIGQLIQWEFE